MHSSPAPVITQILSSYQEINNTKNLAQNVFLLKPTKQLQTGYQTLQVIYLQESSIIVMEENKW